MCCTGVCYGHGVLTGWGDEIATHHPTPPRWHQACELAWEQEGISCELIDLRTLLPWDAPTVVASVKNTGRLVVSHEAPVGMCVGCGLW